MPCSALWHPRQALSRLDKVVLALQRIEKERALQEGFWVKQAMKEQQQLAASGSVGPQVEQLAARLATTQAEAETCSKQQHQSQKQQSCSGASSTVSCSKSVSAVGSSSSRASRAAAGFRCGASKKLGPSASQCGSAMTSTKTVSACTAAIHLQHMAAMTAVLHAVGTATIPVACGPHNGNVCRVSPC
jgi:hypothetical protein